MDQLTPLVDDRPLAPFGLLPETTPHSTNKQNALPEYHCRNTQPVARTPASTAQMAGGEWDTELERCANSLTGFRHARQESAREAFQSLPYASGNKRRSNFEHSSARKMVHEGPGRGTIRLVADSAHATFTLCGPTTQALSGSSISPRSPKITPRANRNPPSSHGCRSAKSPPLPNRRITRTFLQSNIRE